MHDYLVLSIKHKRVETKSWFLRLFGRNSVPYLVSEKWAKPGELFRLEKDRTSATNRFYTLTDEQTLVPVKSTTTDDPVARIRESITFTQELRDVVANAPEVGTVTTIGNVLYNHLCLSLPFGDVIEFQLGKVNPFAVEKQIAKLLVDDREDKGIEATLKLEQYFTYADNVGFLSGMTQLFAPSGSKKTMTIDPAIIKRRNELFKENAGKLNDPATIAGIGKELEDLDRASFKGDVAEDFFIKGKSFGVVRKKRFLYSGIEAGFDATDKPRFIPNSLREGWNYDYAEEMVNSLRAGSFNRGNQTALGGESVKYFYRVFQNTRIVEKDCGIKHGMTFDVSESNASLFVGMHAIVNGKPVFIDKEMILTKVGKPIEVRSATLCQTPNNSYCEICCGKALSRSPHGLHIEASNVGSIFLGIFMSMMHGTNLETVALDLNEAMT